MNVDTETKVLAKFGSLQTVCVDRGSKNLLKLPFCVYMSYTGLYVHSLLIVTYPNLQDTIGSNGFVSLNFKVTHTWA